MTALLLLAEFETGTATTVWCLCGLTLLARLGGDTVRGLFTELRPLYLPLVAAHYVLATVDSGDPFNAAVLFFTAVRVVAWFALKDAGGPDDRWRRRRRKVAAMVSRVGSRLTVAPLTRRGGR